MEMTKEEGLRILLAELEKGRRSGREEGYVDFDEVVKSLGVSTK